MRTFIDAVLLRRAITARAWSGRPDLNRRPSAPKADALPDCATPRAQALDDAAVSTSGQAPSKGQSPGATVAHVRPDARRRPARPRPVDQRPWGAPAALLGGAADRLLPRRLLQHRARGCRPAHGLL